MSDTTTAAETTAAAYAISEEYLAAFRGYLRMKSTAQDGEIKDLINAARDDLVTFGGVLPERARDESDALIKKAIRAYVLADFGLDNEDSEKYRASYDKLKAALALSSDYIDAAEEG